MAGVTRRARGVIKSIQRGQTATPTDNSTTNVTITAVDTDKAFVSFSSTVYWGTSAEGASISAYLTSSTNLAIETIGDDIASSAEIAWEVIEYE